MSFHRPTFVVTPHLLQIWHRSCLPIMILGSVAICAHYSGIRQNACADQAFAAANNGPLLTEDGVCSRRMQENATQCEDICKAKATQCVDVCKEKSGMTGDLARTIFRPVLLRYPVQWSDSGLRIYTQSFHIHINVGLKWSRILPQISKTLSKYQSGH